MEHKRKSTMFALFIATIMLTAIFPVMNERSNDAPKECVLCVYQVRFPGLENIFHQAHNRPQLISTRNRFLYIGWRYWQLA